MKNNLYANGVSAVLQFIGVTGSQICEPICNAVVESNCRKLDAAVDVIKEVTKDMSVFVQISEKFFDTYTKTLEFAESTNQKTIEAYLVVLANDDSKTFEEKVRHLKDIQRESNKSYVRPLVMGTIGATSVILAGIGCHAYCNHCKMKVGLAEATAKAEIAKHASPFSGLNVVLFVVADMMRKG